MEGLRALPWLQEARREMPGHLDCETCKASVEPALRQAMGCGWLAPTRARAWQHRGDPGDAYTTCAGYTTTLPDVTDTARAWVHWDKGQLALRVVGEPSRSLLDGVELLSASIRARDAWALKPKGER